MTFQNTVPLFTDYGLGKPMVLGEGASPSPSLDRIPERSTPGASFPLQARQSSALKSTSSPLRSGASVASSASGSTQQGTAASSTAGAFKPDGGWSGVQLSRSQPHMKVEVEPLGRSRDQLPNANPVAHLEGFSKQLEAERLRWCTVVQDQLTRRIQEMENNLTKRVDDAFSRITALEIASREDTDVIMKHMDALRKTLEATTAPYRPSSGAQQASPGVQPAALEALRNEQTALAATLSVQDVKQRQLEALIGEVRSSLDSNCDGSLQQRLAKAAVDVLRPELKTHEDQLKHMAQLQLAEGEAIDRLQKLLSRLQSDTQAACKANGLLREDVSLGDSSSTMEIPQPPSPHVSWHSSRGSGALRRLSKPITKNGPTGTPTLTQASTPRNSANSVPQAAYTESPSVTPGGSAHQVGSPAKSAYSFKTYALRPSAESTERTSSPTILDRPRSWKSQLEAVQMEMRRPSPSTGERPCAPSNS